MEPTYKSPAINKLLKSLTGQDREKTIAKNICINCGKPAPPDSFRDEISRKEFRISSLCMICQDKIFVDYEKQD